MLFSKNETVEDKIISFLLHKDQTVKGLKKSLDIDSSGITVQGIYKTLKKLIADEVVIKRGTIYSLSEEWKERVISEISERNNRLELAEGERISLELASLVHLDQQWKNIVIPFHKAHPKDPIFFYNPHEIWIHLSESRKKSEYDYYKSFSEQKTYAFALFGGNTIHDVFMKKELQNEYMQVAVGVEHFSKIDYPTIFGDYIITTRISPRLAVEIEKCYQESPNTKILEERLHAIGIEKKKVKLIIERDKEKAKKLRKKLSKEFFVPQELISEFNLF